MGKKKMWYTYTMEFYSTIKKSKVVSFAEKWMEPEIIMLSKISQIQKDKYHMLSFRWGVCFLKKT
jgi:hypothetical protein